MTHLYPQNLNYVSYIMKTDYGALQQTNKRTKTVLYHGHMLVYYIERDSFHAC